MILNEELFEEIKSKKKLQPIDLNEALDIVETEIEETPDESVTNNAMMSIVNGLIKEELDAVQLYNDAIVQCSANGYGQFADVFKDIASEETAHIGELQKLLDEITPTTVEDLQDGQEEATEILNNVTDQEVDVDAEPVKPEDELASTYWDAR